MAILDTVNGKKITEKQILVSHEQLLVDIIASTVQRGRTPN